MTQLNIHKHTQGDDHGCVTHKYKGEWWWFTHTHTHTMDDDDDDYKMNTPMLVLGLNSYIVDFYTSSLISIIEHYSHSKVNL